MTYEDRDTWIKNKLREQKEIEKKTQPNYNSTLENDLMYQSYYFNKLPSC